MQKQNEGLNLYKVRKNWKVKRRLENFQKIGGNLLKMELQFYQKPEIVEIVMGVSVERMELVDKTFIKKKIDNTPKTLKRNQPKQKVQMLFYHISHLSRRDSGSSVGFFSALFFYTLHWNQHSLQTFGRQWKRITQYFRAEVNKKTESFFLPREKKKILKLFQASCRSKFFNRKTVKP